MVRLRDISNQRTARRPKVALVYEDLKAGFRCADRCALHGYQATLSSPDDQLERDLRDLYPDVVVVELPSLPTPLHSTVPRLRSLWPKVPIIAMVDQPLDTRRNGSRLDFVKTFGADVFMCHSLDPPVPLSSQARQ